MKPQKVISKAAIFTILFFLFQGFQPNNLYAQITAIPDQYFEQALIDKGIDSDGIINGQVLTSDINTVTELILGFNFIVDDITGIEDFTALEVLDVSFSNLNVLDVSNNIQLRELYCSSSDAGPSMLFTSLDLSNNVNLEVLFANGLWDLEYLNLKNGNNSMLTTLILDGEFEGDLFLLEDLHCVIVDDPEAASSPVLPYSSWFIYADFIYSIDCILGVVSYSLNDINVYPNPVNDVLYIDNHENFNIEKLVIYDVTGKELLTIKENFSQIELSTLTAGLLFLKIETERGTVIKRIIKV
jgi:hypothetical protein